jgi:hypothetical protein
LTVEELANDFLAYKKKRVASGELSSRSWTDYFDVCTVVLNVLGKGTPIRSLKLTHFEDVRAEFAKRHSVARLAKDITVVRMLFKYADDAHDVRVKLGTDFKPPSRKEQREHRKTKPKKFLDAAQLRAAIDSADPTMKAIIYLGLNAALGNEDIANLSTKNIKGEWLDYPRCKTGEERRAWLWPETREALAAVKLPFRQPNGKTWHSDRGRRKVNGVKTDRVVIDNVLSKAFNALIPDRPTGVSFYALRHVFQTVAEKGGDKEAVRAVMGHATPNDMAARYSEDGVADDRIKAVCEAVRTWLFDGK